VSRSGGRVPGGRAAAWPPRPGGVVAQLITEAVVEDRRFRAGQPVQSPEAWVEWTGPVVDVELAYGRTAVVST
jgi:hypothetical protein